MVSDSQTEKAELFLKFHQDKEILVLLNSWDIGSSKLIEACGYKAIATTTITSPIEINKPRPNSLNQLENDNSGAVRLSTSFT